MSNGPNRSTNATPDRPYRELLASFVARVQAFRPPDKPVSVAQIVRDAYAPISDMFRRGGTEDDVAQLLALEGFSAKREAVRTAWRRITDEAEADTSTAESAVVSSSPRTETTRADPEPQPPSANSSVASIARHLE